MQKKKNKIKALHLDTELGGEPNIQVVGSSNKVYVSQIEKEAFEKEFGFGLTFYKDILGWYYIMGELKADKE